VAINSSLMTLGRCLEALRHNQQQRQTSRAGGAPGAPALRVVPYRESKVTHLFRDALHGYGRVVLSVNVSPCAKDYDETAHVLRYAALATQIGTLQQVEAPRRTIKAVTPGALRRAKRKAAEHKAKEADAKQRKTAKGVQTEPDDVEHQSTIELPPPPPAAAAAAGMEQKEDERKTEHQATNTTQDSQQEIEEVEEVVYEVMSRLQESDEEAIAVVHKGAEESPMHPPPSLLTYQLPNSAGVTPDAHAGTPQGTPSTPSTPSEDASEAAIIVLQAQVQKLIEDLQAAEEKAVLVEGDPAGARRATLHAVV